MQPTEAYRAVRTRAGVYDRPDTGWLAFEGPDRASYLQGLLTNDVEALRPGSGCYAAYLTPQGRMIADMVAFELGDRLVLEVPRSLTDELRKRFEAFVFSEDVRVSALTDDWASLAVAGPGSPGVLAEALERGSDTEEPTAQLADRLGRLPEYSATTLQFREGSVIAVASHDTGEVGFSLLVRHAELEPLRSAVLGAGATVVDGETAEVLRVEAGRARFFVDMDTETIPLEAGIEGRAISFTKGCYVGQEVIIRVLHRGQGRVARRLVGLTFDLDAGVNDAVAPATVLVNDQEVGRVTSAVRSPALDRCIALAYVARDFVTPGTTVVISTAIARLDATVTGLPFVQGGAKRDDPATPDDCSTPAG